MASDALTEKTAQRLLDISANLKGWSVVRRIGSGSFGTVFEISRRGSENSALKIIPIPLSEHELEEKNLEVGGDQQLLRVEFERQVEKVREKEISVLDTCKGQQNIVQILDWEVMSNPDNPVCFYVLMRMELLARLEDYLPGKRQKDVLRMFKDIATALDFLESRRMLHRDIKRANIMVSSRGVYKLTDFGEARDILARNAASTKAGTPYFMAPEVANGRSYDNRADIYSLAMTVYHCLYNFRYPFQKREGMSDITAQESYNMRVIEGREIPPIPDVDQKFNEILLRCLQYDPQERYASARMLLESIERLYGSRNFADAPLTLPKRAGDSGTLTSTGGHHGGRGKKGLIIGLCSGFGACVIAAIVILVWKPWDRDGYVPIPTPTQTVVISTPATTVPASTPTPTPPEPTPTPAPSSAAPVSSLEIRVEGAQRRSDGAYVIPRDGAVLISWTAEGYTGRYLYTLEGNTREMETTSSSLGYNSFLSSEPGGRHTVRVAEKDSPGVYAEVTFVLDDGSAAGPTHVPVTSVLLNADSLDSSAVKGETRVFRWGAQGDAESYTFRLLDGGTEVLKEAVTEGSYSLNTAALESGKTYDVEIQAHSYDGGGTVTGVTRFTLEPTPVTGISVTIDGYSAGSGVYVVGKNKAAQMNWQADGEVQSYNVYTYKDGNLTGSEVTSRASLIVASSDMEPGCVYTKKIEAVPRSAAEGQVTEATAQFTLQTDAVSGLAITIDGNPAPAGTLAVKKDSKVRVSWTAAGDVQSYDVQLTANGQAVAPAESGGNSRVYDTSRWQVGRNYELTVTAHPYGTSGGADQMAKASLTLSPDPVSGLAISVNGNLTSQESAAAVSKASQVRVSWAATGDVKSYTAQLTTNGQPLGAVDSSETSRIYDTTTWNLGQEYKLTVTAHPYVGEDQTASATLILSPETVSGLVISVNGTPAAEGVTAVDKASRVRVSWTASGDVRSYDARLTANGEPVEAVESGETSRTYDTSAWILGQEYELAVTAHPYGGGEDRTASATLTLAAAPLTRFALRLQGGVEEGGLWRLTSGGESSLALDAAGDFTDLQVEDADGILEEKDGKYIIHAENMTAGRQYRVSFSALPYATELDRDEAGRVSAQARLLVPAEYGETTLATYGGPDAPQSAQISFSGGEAGFVSFALQGEDGEAGEVSLNGGSYAVDAATGAVIYTPEAGFLGDPDPVTVVGVDENGQKATCVYQPHVVDDVEKREVTRSILYTYRTEGGRQAAEPVEQRLVYSRAWEIDGVSGEKTSAGPWELTDRTGDGATASPAISGWKASQASVPSLESGIAFSADGQIRTPGDVQVVYNSYAPTAADMVTYGGVGDAQSAAPVFAMMTRTTEDGGENAMEAGSFRLLRGTMEYVSIENSSGVYTVNETTGEVTFTPAQGYVGAPEPVFVVGYDKNGQRGSCLYQPRVVNNVERQTVTRSIRYTYGTEDGPEAAVPAEQKVVLARALAVNPATGETEGPGTWSVENASGGGEVTSPVKSTGWEADPATVSGLAAALDLEAEEQPATLPDVLVVYHAQAPAAEDIATSGSLNETQKAAVSFQVRTRTTAAGARNEMRRYCLLDANGEETDSVTVYDEGREVGSFTLVSSGLADVTFAPAKDAYGASATVTVRGYDANGLYGESRYTASVQNAASVSGLTLTADGQAVSPDTTVAVERDRNVSVAWTADGDVKRYSLYLYEDDKLIQRSDSAVSPYSLSSADMKVGSVYTVKVTAIPMDGSGSQSSTAEARFALTARAVTGVTLLADGQDARLQTPRRVEQGGECAITWQAEGDVKSYTLQLYEDGRMIEWIDNAVSPYTLSAADMKLNSAYTVKVTAVPFVSAENQNTTAEGQFVLAPRAVTGLALRVNGQSASMLQTVRVESGKEYAVSWTADGDVKRYTLRLYEEGRLIRRVNDVLSPYTLSSSELKPGKNYVVRVLAEPYAAEDQSVTAQTELRYPAEEAAGITSLTLQVNGGAVTGGDTVEVDGGGEAVVAWQADGPVQGYILRLYEGDAAVREIHVTGTEYRLSGADLQPERDYVLEVEAKTRSRAEGQALTARTRVRRVDIDPNRITRFTARVEGAEQAEDGVYLIEPGSEAVIVCEWAGNVRYAKAMSGMGQLEADGQTIRVDSLRYDQVYDVVMRLFPGDGGYLAEGVERQCVVSFALKPMRVSRFGVILSGAAEDPENPGVYLINRQRAASLKAEANAGLKGIVYSAALPGGESAAGVIDEKTGAIHAEAMKAGKIYTFSAVGELHEYGESSAPLTGAVQARVKVTPASIGEITVNGSPVAESGSLRISGSQPYTIRWTAEGDAVSYWYRLEKEGGASQETVMEEYQLSEGLLVITPKNDLSYGGLYTLTVGVVGELVDGRETGDATSVSVVCR